MKLLVAVVMFVIGSSAFAGGQSPNPIPSPGKESQPVQNPSAHKDHKAGAPNTPGKDPLFLIDRQYSAAVGKPDVHNPSGQPGQSSSDGWGWGWMTVFTLALVVLGGIQTYIYSRQARLMRDSLEVTRQSAKAAQDSADAASESAKAATKSAEVAERALKVTERADVVIRGWQFYSSPTGTKDDAKDRIMFYRFNGGRTRATMISAYGAVALVPHTPSTPLSFPGYKENLTEEIRGIVISTQGTHTALMDPLTADQREARDQGTRRMYAFGYLLYEDVFGDRHEVASLALYDANVGRFVVAESPEYNYSRPIDKENQ